MTEVVYIACCESNVGSVSVSGSTSSAGVSLGTGSAGKTKIIAYNDGSGLAFLKTGKTSATATSSGNILPVGAMVTYDKPPEHDYAAVIFSSGSGNVYFMTSDKI